MAGPRGGGPGLTRPHGVSAAALAVYEAAVVIDAHNDMPSKVLDNAYDPDVRHAPGFAAGQGHTDLPRLLESGITAQWMAAWVDASYAQRTPDGSFARALELVDVVLGWTGRHPGVLRLVTTGTEVRRAKEGGWIAILLGVEGGHAIEASLDKLSALHARGVRYLTLTWNNGNAWAGSSIGADGTSTGGLTPFGRLVIREMERLGMLVDVSHVSSATLRDTLMTAQGPVIASHSCARALADHPRNLTDDELRAIAATGGIVNVNFYSRFLDPAYLAATRDRDAALSRLRSTLTAEGGAGVDAATVDAAIAAERDRLAGTLPATPLAVLLDHVDYIARTAGIEYVGLGSDFDGISAVPIGLDDVTALPRLAQGLLDRGYGTTDVARVLGGNMLRVMEVVLG